jgi:predicted HicB family RNase H-like nuclease
MFDATRDLETKMTNRKPLQLRLPPDLKTWIAAQAEANASSQNSEIIRAIRERMDCIKETVT